VVNLKENVEIVVQLDIKRKTVNQKLTKMAVRTAEITTIFRKIKTNGAYCTYCFQPGHIKSNCFKLKNKSSRDSGTNNNDGQGHRIINSNNDEFTSISMKSNYSSDMWIFDSGDSCDYC
jgi:hypothetical protein